MNKFMVTYCEDKYTVIHEVTDFLEIKSHVNAFLTLNLTQPIVKADARD
jgi:hypothetical protein